MKFLFILGMYSVIMLVVASAICLKDSNKDARTGAILLTPIIAYVLVTMINLF